MECSNLLVDIIRNNGDMNYEMGIEKYTCLTRRQLLENGIPYNFYLLIQTTSSNGSVNRYAFVKLFHDVEYACKQKILLLDLLDEVRSFNKIPRVNYGVAGKRAGLLNCDDDSRIQELTSTDKFKKIMEWLESNVLSGGGNTDKYGNLKKCFYNERFYMIETRPIVPIMKIAEENVTGETNANSTDVTIVMGFPIELR